MPAGEDTYRMQVVLFVDRDTRKKFKKLKNYREEEGLKPYTSAGIIKQLLERCINGEIELSPE